MVFAALTSAWSRGPNSMEQRIAWLWRLTGIRATDMSARCRVDGHHLMGVAIVAPGGQSTLASRKAGWQAREPPVRMAYHEGRMARLYPLRDLSGSIAISALRTLHSQCLRRSDAVRLMGYARLRAPNDSGCDTLTVSHGRSRFPPQAARSRLTRRRMRPRAVAMND